MKMEEIGKNLVITFPYNPSACLIHHTFWRRERSAQPTEMKMMWKIWWCWDGVAHYTRPDQSPLGGIRKSKEMKRKNVINRFDCLKFELVFSLSYYCVVLISASAVFRNGWEWFSCVSFDFCIRVPASRQAKAKHHQAINQSIKQKQTITFLCTIP